MTSELESMAQGEGLKQSKPRDTAEELTQETSLRFVTSEGETVFSSHTFLSQENLTKLALYFYLCYKLGMA